MAEIQDTIKARSVQIGKLNVKIDGVEDEVGKGMAVEGEVGKG